MLSVVCAIIFVQNSTFGLYYICEQNLIYNILIINNVWRIKVRLYMINLAHLGYFRKLSTDSAHRNQLLRQHVTCWFTQGIHNESKLWYKMDEICVYKLYHCTLFHKLLNDCKH